jgi:hypothetical protein
MATRGLSDSNANATASPMENPDALAEGFYIYAHSSHGVNDKGASYFLCDSSHAVLIGYFVWLHWSS